MIGYVYLLHFDKPLKHARHYLGWSKDHPEKLGGRISQHEKGIKSASRLMQVLKENNIGFKVAKIWEGDRDFERSLKKKKNSKGFCPICLELKTQVR